MFPINEKTPPLITHIIFISVFLFSLGSYYFYQVGLYVFQLLGVILLLPYFKLDKIKYKKIKIIKAIIFALYIFIFSSCLSLILGSSSFGISKLAMPFFIFLYFSFSIVLFCIYPEIFQRALTTTIVIHVIFFAFQFIWFLVTLEMIDFLQPLTGETQRALGGSYSLTYLPNFIRPTGLFNEPGTYSTWMIIMLLLLKSNSIRLDLKPVSPLFEITVVGSVLFSFSTFGFIFSLIYIVSSTMGEKISWKKLFILLAVSVFFSYFGYEYLSSRFSLSENVSGIGIRSQVIKIYLDNLNFYNLLFGLGSFNNFFTKIDTSVISQDLGLWFSLLSGNGFIGAILLALMIFNFKKIPCNLALLVVLLLAKFTITNALVWFVLFYFLMSQVNYPNGRSSRFTKTIRMKND